MELNKALIISGLKSIIINYGNRNSSPFRPNDTVPTKLSHMTGEDFVSECIEFLFKENLSDDVFIRNFDSNDFTGFLLACQKVGIDCSKDKRLYSTIKSKIKALDIQISNWTSIGYSQRSSLDLYARMLNSLDHEDINIKSLNKLMLLLEGMSTWYKANYVQALSSIYNVSFSLNGNTKGGVKSIHNKYFKNIKKHKKKINITVLMGTLKYGKLDKKTARKMRSDASEYVSQKCIEELFNHRKIYDSKTFKTLFLQFGDSNYYQVRRYLAENVPANEIMCLMGTDCEATKGILKRRFEQYYSEKEESANEQ